MNHECLYKNIVSFFSDSKKVMWLAFMIGVICSTLLIVFGASVYRDSVIYSSMAQDFSLGDWNRFIAGRIPPLFPCLAGIICKLGIPVHYASMTVGCLFCVLTIFPLFGLLNFFMEKKYAAWGVLLYMTAPKVLRFGLTSLLESGKIFFLTLAIYLIFSFYYKRKFTKLIYLGFTLACLSMYRSEGIIYFPIILAGLFMLMLKENNYKITFQFIRKFVLHVIIVASVLLLILSPRFYQVYKQTGFPALDARGAYAIETVINKFLAPTGKFEILNVNNPDDPQDPTSGSFNFSWALTSKQLNNFVMSFARGSYELYLVLSIIGLILILKRREWTINHTFLLWLTITNALFFYIFTAVAIRYFLINVISLMPFTVVGFIEVFNWIKRIRLHKFTAVLLLFLAIAQIINGMNNCLNTDEFYYKELGQWIKTNQSDLKNTGDSNPFTVMLLGRDYGLGLWAESNIVHCNSLKNRQPGTGTDITIALNGFSAKQCSFIKAKMSETKILRPDIIAIFDPDDFVEELDILRAMPGIIELHNRWDSKVIVFKNNN